MEGRKPTLRTIEDFDRAIRALGFIFKTNTVFVVGSQAILATWPDAPASVRMSPEVDAYPGNARQWEAENSGLLASEEIFASFGEGSDFHATHGFHIDGVDDRTATLPQDWQVRAIKRSVPDAYSGVTITAIAPSIEDLVISKLARMDDKDKAFVEAVHARKPLDIEMLKELLKKTPLMKDASLRIERFLERLSLPGSSPEPSPPGTSDPSP